MTNNKLETGVYKIGSQGWRAILDGCVIKATWNSKGAAEAGIDVERRRRDKKKNELVSNSAKQKLRPDGPWRPNCDIFPEQQKERGFDQTINEFVWYNCQLNETGYYPAYYVRENKTK